MARRLAWSNVRGGLIAIAAIVGICAATLKYARVGALRGDRIRLYVVVGAARGILTGSEVWLMGQKVGRVADIRFRSPSESDTTARVMVELEVLEKYREAMHRDAVAQIRPGGSLIGAMVVYLAPGTTAAPTIRDGDTVRAKPQSDVESTTARFGAATKELPAIVGNVKSIRSTLSSTSGSIGALMQSAQAERGATAVGVDAAGPTPPPNGQRQRVAGPYHGRIIGHSGDGLRWRAPTPCARSSGRRAPRSAGSGETARSSRKSQTSATSSRRCVRRCADSRGTAGRVVHDSAAFMALGDVHREMSAAPRRYEEAPAALQSFLSRGALDPLSGDS